MKPDKCHFTHELYQAMLRLDPVMVIMQYAVHPVYAVRYVRNILDGLGYDFYLSQYKQMVDAIVK